MQSLKQTIMRRDNLSANHAEAAITEAKEALQEYLSIGDLDSAEHICEEYFGLEPDFIMDLM